ncbi:MAG: hypothetical protein ABJN14_12255 [Paracoccaceae bacterium]
MRDEYPREAPNLTNACIVMFGVNVAWILVAIWAIWGLIAAAFMGLSINRLISHMHVWSMARRAAAIRRGKNT